MVAERDDCYDLGDAMDILQGLRFHMPGRQWQMLDDMVAAKLRADAALGPPAVKPGHGAGTPRKQVELLKKRTSVAQNRLCAGSAGWSVV